jgi:glycosyltransferase involved in cell wall biosynthesis
VPDDTPGAVTVSVCMPTARDASVIKRALASVLAQDLEDFEILVGDETGAAEPAVVAADDARIRYFRNPHRLGFSANHVALLDRARGRYIAILHDDDWWEPTYLSSMARVLDEETDVGLVCCGVVLDRGPGAQPSPWPIPVSPGRHDHVLDILLREEWFLLPNATMVRREVWTGPTREWPSLCCGDLQLFLSVADAGWALYFLPAPLTHWVQHTDQSGAWRGADSGLGVADDVLAFWDGWLAGRPAAQVALTNLPRARWHLRRARALLLVGRGPEARAAIKEAAALGGNDLAGLRRIAFVSRLPSFVVRAGVSLKRAVGH